MPPSMNRQILLRRRPSGMPEPGDFELVESPVLTPGEGEFLCRTIYLSLDPYMRGRISGGQSYAASVEPGQVIVGGTVGEVIESRHPGVAQGDLVLGYDGWQAYAVSRGVGVRKLDPEQAPISTALGVLGMPGMTAYVGLLDIGQPKPEETVVVSAASGAVGSAVGQIAKIKGARAVGIAGGADKCSYVTGELGFDACVDYRAGDFPERLEAACPKGADVYFENVGGPVFDAVLPLFNPFARIPVCGLIAMYNATEPPPGPDRLPLIMRNVLTKRLTIRGFIVTDFAAKFPDFIRDMPQWIKEGRIKYREDIAEGLENAPQAFIGLLKGKNFGKQLVRVAD